MGHFLMAIWEPQGSTPLPWLAVTIVAYVLGQIVQGLCKGAPLANPVLIAILVVSVLLEATGTPLCPLLRRRPVHPVPARAGHGGARRAAGAEP